VERLTRLARRLRKEVLLGAAIAALGLGVAAVVYRVERDALQERAEQESYVLLETIANAALEIFSPARELVRSIQDAGIADAAPAEALTSYFAVTTGPLRNIPQLSAVHVGFADGSFWQTRGVPPDSLAADPRVPKDMDKTVRRVIDAKARDGMVLWSVYDKDKRVWVDIRIRDASYDPRRRPWYRVAAVNPGVHWSEPYRTASGDELKLTMSQQILTRADRMWGVVAVDFYLGGLTSLLDDWQANRLLKGSWIAIVDPQGEPVARAPAELDPTFAARLALLKAANKAGSARFVHDGREYFGAIVRLGAAINLPLDIVIAQPVEAIVGPAAAAFERNLITLLGALAILVVVAIYAVKMREEIKARKAAELELLRAHEIAVAARAEAEAATKAKSSFLAMMSHEIRTPMNGVMSMAEMLDQTDLTGDQRGMTTVIRGSAYALLTVINDILDFSKIEAGKLDIEKVEFSLVEVIEGSADLIAARAEDKAIGLHVDLDPDIPDKLVGDPTRLRQILLNLLGNAVKFTDKGSVSLTVAPVAGEPATLRFDVADTGIGLTEEQRGKLFQAFVQADTSTSRKFGGTGLGLSISQRLAEMMGGKIGVTSVFGRGSTFWFELPFGVADPAPLRPPVDISDLRLAVIGLSAPRSRILARFLGASGVAPNRVAWLDFDDDPIERMRGAADKPDLIVISAESASETALELGRAIMADPALGSSKVVFFASRRLASSLAAARERGFFALLVPPVARRRLWQVFAAALGRADLDEKVGGAADDSIGWQAPSIEDARAAGALVLVAEDNATNRIVIGRLLAQRGYAYEIGEDGKAALALQAQGGHGLLLTDFHMPEMDGFELTAALRAREAEAGGGARLPIVALTADALPGTEQKCVDAGMDGYLTKPIDSKALTAVLERFLPQAAALRRRASEAPAEASAGPAVDPEIVDLDHLKSIFGEFDGDARSFLVGFVDDVPRLIGDIATGLTARDAKQARKAAHALKGAAKSAGATRLGRLASDLQDRLDDEDLDTADILYDALLPTHAELAAAIGPFRDATAKPG